MFFTVFCVCFILFVFCCDIRIISHFLFFLLFRFYTIFRLSIDNFRCFVHGFRKRFLIVFVFFILSELFFFSTVIYVFFFCFFLISIQFLICV